MKIYSNRKKFNIYIKDIYLIINDKDLIVLIFPIKDFEHLSSDYCYSRIYLLKRVFKSNLDFELIHVVISKFIIDKDYFELPEDINQKAFFRNKVNLFKKGKLIDLKKFY